MRLFLTGATGFLGREVARACLERGHEVRAMVRDERARVPKGAVPAPASFDQPGRLVEALDGTDAVLHLAGKVSRDPKDASEMHWIHVEATRTLLDAMEKASVRRVVLASTSGTVALRSEPGPPATEEEAVPFELIGRWPYYTSKLLQEQEVLRRDADDRVEAIVLNPSLLLGPGDDRGSSTGDVLDILHRRIPALTEGTVAFTDVRDAAPMFLAALERGKRGQRYLLNGANMSVRSFVERVASIGGVAAPKIGLPKRWATTGARLLGGLAEALDRTAPLDPVSVDMGCHHWGADASKAKRELAFTARDPQATLIDTVRDLEARGLFRRSR